MEGPTAQMRVQHEISTGERTWRTESVRAAAKMTVQGTALLQLRSKVHRAVQMECANGSAQCLEASVHKRARPSHHPVRRDPPRLVLPVCSLRAIRYDLVEGFKREGPVSACWAVAPELKRLSMHYILIKVTKILFLHSRMLLASHSGFPGVPPATGTL